MKNLQETLTKYLNDTSLENITIESILSTFKDVNVKDDQTDLYLSHALVNEKYEEEKVYKMLQILFENGLDPNQKGFAEYTFLHIALYGAETEEKEKTIPYPLSFFKSVVPLAIKYGLDVNSKDEEGDTLIHTAIYSEDYFDKIEPLIRLLGNDFNLTSKNKQGETILDALNSSLKEAKNTKNTAWRTQLELEQKFLTSIMEASSNTMFNIPEYSEESVNISSYLDPERFKNKIWERIHKLVSDFETEEYEKLTMEMVSKKCKILKEDINNSSLTKEEKENFLSEIDKREKLIVGSIKNKIEEKINELTVDSSLNECKNIQTIISQSYLPVEIVEELGNEIIILIEKINQQLLITQLKKGIEDISTISDIENCLTETSKIKDPDFKQEIIEELEGKKQEAKKRLDQLRIKFQSVKNLLDLDKAYFGVEHYQNEKRKVFNNINLREVKDTDMETLIIIQYLDEYEEGIEALSEEITNKMKETLAKAIRSELKKAETIDRKAGTHILNQLTEEFMTIIEEKNQGTENPNPTEETQASIPKQKRKK